MLCTRKVQCVLYFECIYISSDKLKCSQVNCTMCTTPILSVPKHIISKMEGVNFEPVTILECVLTHFLNLSQHTWNCVKCMRPSALRVADVERQFRKRDVPLRGH